MTEPTLRKAKIDEFRPQEQNANRHTQRGMRELEKSIGEDGYVAPMSAAADGELLDGSARLETVANLFDEEVFVVEHDGSVPIVMKRTDIPDAKADIARRIAIRANRIAELNLDWDAGVLLGSVDKLDIEGLFDKYELKALVEEAKSKSDFTPPADFKDYDENIEIEHRCPKCGYEWSGKSK